MPLPNRTAAAAKLTTGNSEITNSPLSRWNGNTATGRRARDLYRGYLAALSNPTDVPTMALVLVAAELVVIAENTRRDHLAGKVDINSVIRAEGAANRALRRLGLSKAAPPPKGKSFFEKLEEKEAALQARAAADAADGAETASNSDKRTGDVASQSDGVAA